MLVLIPEPTTLAGHTDLSSFLGVGGVNWSWEMGRGEQVTLPLVSTQGTTSVPVDWLPISVIENSAASQKLPTAALLMTGVVVLGNSLGCL